MVQSSACSLNANPDPREVYGLVRDNIAKVVKGQRESIRKLLAALASGGHVLLEDVPGTGKTTLAKALACSIDASLQRLQFTPDLLPSDVLGVSIFNQRDQIFEFHQGPVFTNILLADEINRASPRTQSALLESMAEGQVTLDGVRRPLHALFFVIATQNPIEFAGTYPLPEAQMDRFALRFSLGYVSSMDEVAILADQGASHPLNSIKACVSINDIMCLQAAVREVRVSDELKHYIVNLVNATRACEGVRVGASPRASLALMKAAQALSYFDAQDFTGPDQIQEIAPAVIAHRLVMESQAQFSGVTPERIVEQVLENVSVPG